MTFIDQAKNLRFLASKQSGESEIVRMPRSAVIEAAEAIELLVDLRRELSNVPDLIKNDGII